MGGFPMIQVRLQRVRHPRYSWRVRWTEKGRDVQRWFVSRSEARTFADVKRAAFFNVAQGVRLSAEERVAVLRVRAWRAGQEQPPAWDELVSRALEHFSQQSSRLTVRELCEARIAEAAGRDLSKGFLANLKSGLGRFSADFGSRLAAEMKPGEIEDWLRARFSDAVTFGNVKRVISGAFELAVRRGELGRNPCAAIASPRARLGEPEILQPEELASLLGAAAPAAVALIVLQAFCGLRKAEALRLCWGHVRGDGETPFVEVPAAFSKVGRRRLGYLPACASAWLAPLRKAEKAPVVTAGEGVVRAALAAAWAVAGQGRGWPKNGLRHSFGTYRLEMTGDVGRVALEMGNSPTVVRQHYLGFARPGQGKTWFSIAPPPPPGA